MADLRPVPGQNPFYTTWNAYEAVSRHTDGSLKNQFGPVTNVKDQAYGAVGDGLTDDTAAIDLAVAAAAGAGGGALFFPPGTYLYNSASGRLDIPANAVLQGAGTALSIIKLGGVANGYVRLFGARSSISNITVQRGNTTVSRLVEAAASSCVASNVLFDGNSLAGPGMTANSSADGLLVTGCTFDGIDGNGFAANGVDRLRLVGNEWSGHLGSSGSPINLNTNNNRFIISNNNVLSDPTATLTSILVANSSVGATSTHGIISQNYIEAVAEAIGIQKTGAGDTAPQFFTVTGNIIKTIASADGVSGISVGIDNSTITGNTINNNSISTGTGIELNKCTNCSVTGNVIVGSGATTNAIILEGASNNTVVGNTINGFKDTTSASSCGIYLYADATHPNCNGNTISANKILFTQAAAGTLEFGILLGPAHSSAHCDRNAITGNQVYGNNVTNSRGISFDVAAGTADSNLIGMNVLQNLATTVFRNGDTNTLLNGDIWNLTGSLANTRTVSGTTDTLVLADSGKTVEYTSGSAVTATVPTNASVAFLLGTVIELAQYGAGQVTVSPAGGVTVRSPSGKLKLTGQYSKAALVKRATDEWWLEGDIAA